MIYLYLATGLAVLLSLILSREKTIQALKITLKRFIGIMPAFLTMLILVSIILFLIPDAVISEYLGHKNKYLGMGLASAFGSITFMPGFIAFPLAGILLQKNVAYMVLSAFTTTLMMVGIITYPMEKAYFGLKTTILRNVIGYLIAIFTAVITGLAFGELL